MEKNRNQKLLMIITLVLAVASLSIGFAAFSVSLNISSQATISPNSDTFSVKFSTNKDSLIVSAVTPSDNPYNLTTTNGTIDNSTNPIIKNLSVTFTEPGQYVEYTFYARNEGEYTAYLNNINFIGNKTCTGDQEATDALVQMACESINITATIGNVTYTETTPITGHTLNKKTGEQVKIRLEYSTTGTYVDGPFTINFPYISVVYSTLDDSSITPTLSKKIAKVISGDINTIGSETCIEEECFYIISTTEDAVTMLAKYNLNVGYYSPDGTIITPYDTTTGIQDSTMRGYTTKEERRDGVEYFAPTTYWSDSITSYPSYVYNENSYVSSHLSNYNAYLNNKGLTIDEIRLIKLEELESLGCSYESNTCKNAPEFIYYSSYWSGTATSANNVIRVRADKNLNANQYSSISGVRPVITISKSEF